MVSNLSVLSLRRNRQQLPTLLHRPRRQLWRWTLQGQLSLPRSLLPRSTCPRPSQVKWVWSSLPHRSRSPPQGLAALGLPRPSRSLRWNPRLLLLPQQPVQRGREFGTALQSTSSYPNGIQGALILEHPALDPTCATGRWTPAVRGGKLVFRAQPDPGCDNPGGPGKPKTPHQTPAQAGDGPTRASP